MNCKEREILKKIHKLLSDALYPFAGQEAYLVGGYVRDILLDRRTNDIDLLVLNYAKEFALVVADQCDGSFVILDAENQAYRVVFKQNGLSVDIVGPKGKNLEEDLCKRDYTINSLAIPLSVYLEKELSDAHPNFSTKVPAGIVDYSNGLQHLMDKQLVCTYDNAFADDPLRILRGIRLSVILGLNIPNATKQRMIENVIGLSKVSFERIREEMWIILAQPKASESVSFLIHEVPALPLLLADRQPNGQQNEQISIASETALELEAISESIDTLRAWENYWNINHATDKSIRLASYIDQVIGANKTRTPLLKFAFLLRGILLKEINIDLHPDQQKDQQPDQILLWIKRWKLSRGEMDILKSWLTKKYPWDQLDLHELYDTYGADSPGAFILHFFFNKQRDFHVAIEKIFKYIDELQALPQLLTGKELMQLFRMPANQEISKTLRKIQKAQLDGIVATREEAISYLRRCFLK